MPEVISPIVISGEAQPVSLSAPPPVSAPPPAALPSAPAPSYEPPAAPAVDVSNAVVRGFALQVPLALALRQLLPVGYTFYIDQDVDTNTLVSYRGGRPWPETLKSMLAPVGLVDQIQGTVVTVSRVPGTSKPSAAPAMPIAEKTPLLHPAPAPSAPKTIGQLTIPAAAPAAPPPQHFAAPAPMASAPMTPYAAAEAWSAQRGDTLHKVLTSWCRKANVELQWLSEYDYPLQASVSFSSGFEDAVRGLLSGFENAQPQPVGELHASSIAGQMVLVVQVRGNSYTN